MILITSGTGYIGSHTWVALAKANCDFIVIDNLSNSHSQIADRMDGICGGRSPFVKGDIGGSVYLDCIFAEYPISDDTWNWQTKNPRGLA